MMLDPYAAVFYNKWLLSQKFHFLPEYVQDATLNVNAKQNRNLSHNRVTFLFIGSIDDRKGVIETLNALFSMLSHHTTLQTKLAIVIAGRIAENMRAPIQNAVARLLEQFLYLDITIEDRYLSDSEFINYVEAADVVCVPYVYFIGTSSILSHAAAYGRVVLSTDFGVVGEMTRRDNLGVVCNESDVQELGQAILACIQLAQQPMKVKENGYAFTTKYSLPLTHYGEAICKIIASDIGV